MDEGRIAVLPENRDIRREGRRIGVEEEGRVIPTFGKSRKTTLKPEFGIYESELGRMRSTTDGPDRNRHDFYRVNHSFEREHGSEHFAV